MRRSLRRTSTSWGYESRTLMIYGGLDYRIGRCKSVIFGSFPTRPHDAIRDARRSRRHRRRPFTNRMRDNISRRMQGLEPLSTDSESETEEEKLSEATITTTYSKTLPSSRFE
ncbi:hypothetical protein HA466_0211390 [Hirschfeldia incana]|nr:hypothetical protein HA466_0211390 [Hirschfeldia incana]